LKNRSTKEIRFLQKSKTGNGLSQCNLNEKYRIYEKQVAVLNGNCDLFFRFGLVSFVRKLPPTLI